MEKYGSSGVNRLTALTRGTLADSTDNPHGFYFYFRNTILRMRDVKYPMLGFFTVSAAVEFLLGWILLHAVDAHWMGVNLALTAGTAAGLGLLGGLAIVGSLKLKAGALERARLENALQSANGKHLDNDRRFRRMLESLPQPAWIANAYGNLEWFNQGWKEYTGMGADQAQGKSRAWEWASVLAPAEAQVCAAQWRKCVASGITFESECRLRRASDGAYRRHSVRALPLRDVGGRIVQWLGTCTDIETRAETRVEARVEAKPFRILVADDDQIGQAVSTRLLEQMGYLVTAVANGSEALASMKKHQFDLVLMDCQMPGMNGYETTSEIRNLPDLAGKDIPIIAVTGDTATGGREKCLEAGMSDYLAKPVSPDALAQVMQSWLKKRGGSVTL
jgi:PAS domain S-box-containing protein